MTLRRRLVLALAVVALIVVGSTVTDLVILRDSLRDELDKQLFAATRELVDRADRLGDNSSSQAHRPLTDLIIDDLSANRSVSVVPRPAGSDELPRLPPDVLEAHAADRSAPIEPFDVTASSGARYRVAAVRMANGRIVVAALPTERIDATFRRVAVGSAIVGLVLLTVMALLAWWVERLGLLPIRSIAAAAQAIESGETTRRVDPAPSGTEADNLARAFNRMVDQRQATEDRLRRFVADASHELRTPLTTIAGVYQLLQSGSLTGPDLDEAVRRAGSEVSRMTSLLEDLLLLTQLDHGRPLADEHVDLAALVGDAAVDAGLIQPERPVMVEVPGQAVVRGDEARLRQVVTNLVGNALTHTPPSVELRLAVHHDGDAYVLEVCDDGPGLTVEQAEHVFDRFYRITPSRSRRNGGSGLGLSIVWSIVMAHHGQVSVTAAPDRGCRFRVVLPTDFQRTSRGLSGDDEAGEPPLAHDKQPQVHRRPTQDRSTRRG